MRLCNSPRSWDRRLGASHLKVSWFKPCNDVKTFVANSLPTQSVHKSSRKETISDNKKDKEIRHHLHTHRFLRLWWVCASHKFAFHNVPSVACLFYMLAHVDAQSWLQTAHVQGAPHLVRKHFVAVQPQEENLLLHEVFHSANCSCLPHIIRVWPCTFSHAAKSEV